MHVTRFPCVERAGAMHGCLVVPYHQVELPPFMRVDKLPLRRMFDQVAQECAGFGNRPTDDRPGMRCQVKRFATGRWVPPDQALPYRRELASLVIGEIGETDLRAGK